MAYIHSSIIRIRIRDTYTVLAPCITIEPSSKVEPGHLVTNSILFFIYTLQLLSFLFRQMKIPLKIPYISVNVYVYVYNKNQGNISKCLCQKT